MIAGKPSRISGPERKASIIAAASKLFAAKGFTGTKTKAIARQAGVSEALLFKHFPSKHDLYAAILAKQSPIPAMLGELKALADEGNDLKVFSHLARTIVRKVPDVQLMRLLLFSALEQHELSTMFAQSHLCVFYEFLAGYIDRRIAEGAFRPIDPLLASRAFMGMLIYHRLLSQLFRIPVVQTPEEIEATFVTVFLDGLRAGRITQTRSRNLSRTNGTRRKKKKRP